MNDTHTDQGGAPDPQLVAALLRTNEPGYLESLLPPEEIAEYERCKQSVIDARRAGERLAWELWIA